MPQVHELLSDIGGESSLLLPRLRRIRPRQHKLRRQDSNAQRRLHAPPSAILKPHLHREPLKIQRVLHTNNLPRLHRAQRQLPRLHQPPTHARQRHVRLCPYELQLSLHASDAQHDGHHWRFTELWM